MRPFWPPRPKARKEGNEIQHSGLFCVARRSAEALSLLRKKSDNITPNFPALWAVLRWPGEPLSLINIYQKNLVISRPILSECNFFGIKPLLLAQAHTKSEG